jgi:allantoicase
MNDFLQLADLASHRLGGRVIGANDDFFARKENLLKESKPIFIEGKYTSRGKWMDGWETRRRRTPGYDWCIVRLGLPGIIRGIVVDTSFFTGNYPERFSLEGCDLGGQLPYKGEKKKLASSNLAWTQIFPETQLKGDSQNLFPVADENRFTHLRLKIYPDGGVARLRIHGEAIAGAKHTSRAEVDLVAVENGGRVLLSSDQFYGAPRNLLMPYAAKNMGDGWETKRRRGPGHDWIVLKLGVPGTVHRIEVNTAHYKGNFPDMCSLEVCNAPNRTVDATTIESLTWQGLLPRTKLKPNHRHVFNTFPAEIVATHARFHIYPDGGVSRLRLFGRVPASANPTAAALERFNRLPRKQAMKHLLDCCGSTKWAEQMAQQRPYATLAALYQSATDIWSVLSREDWLEAFRHHPAIGATRASAKRSPTASRWSASEQSAAQAAPRDVLAALLAENNAYAQRFGYVFLICATGKTSEEILHALRQRISNTLEAELRMAAEEQNKITRLRLEKLLAS